MKKYKVVTVFRNTHKEAERDLKKISPLVPDAVVDKVGNYYTVRIFENVLFNAAEKIRHKYYSQFFCAIKEIEVSDN